MQDPANAFSPAEFLTSQQIRSFWSGLAQQRSNNPTRHRAMNSDGSPFIRSKRDTAEEILIDDAANEVFIEICDMEPADFDILEIDPELYIINFLSHTDCFE